MNENEDGLLLASILIERRVDEEGRDVVTASFADGNGDMPRLVEVLGMLELTKDTAVRMSTGLSE